MRLPSAVLQSKVQQIFCDNRISGIPENLKEANCCRDSVLSGVVGQRIPDSDRKHVFISLLWAALCLDLIPAGRNNLSCCSRYLSVRSSGIPGYRITGRPSFR